MTLTTDGKNYIAQHFGISNCYAASGINYTDPMGLAATGSTSDVVATLKLDDGGLSRGPGGEIYDNIVTANGGTITNFDIIEISSNDGDPATEPTYCIEACEPYWQCEIPLNEYEEDGCGNRRPNVNCKDPCEGIVCPNICIDYNLYSQKCVNGECVTDTLIESNSLSCEYEPPEEPNILTYIIPIGLGIGLLVTKLMKKK